MDSYAAFDPEIGEIVDRFFHQRWIDAALRAGKRGGAFCAAVTPDRHPYVLLNYTGKPRDVMTLGHELGHGVHDVLSRVQSILEYHPPLALAETASVFGEILVFDALRQQLDDPRERLAFLAARSRTCSPPPSARSPCTASSSASTACAATRASWTPRAFGDVWQEEHGRHVRRALELTEGHSLLVELHPALHPHAVLRLRLSVRAVPDAGLYALYHEEGAAFLPRYRQAFSAGGSVAPRPLMASVGIDIADPGVLALGHAVHRGPRGRGRSTCGSRWTSAPDERRTWRSR